MSQDNPSIDGEQNEDRSPTHITGDERTARSRYGRREVLAGLGVGVIGIAGTGALLPATSTKDSIEVSSATYRLPSTDGMGTGGIVTVHVEATSGTGRLLVDLSDSEPMHDVQVTLREAFQRASELSETDHHDVDLSVWFDSSDNELVKLEGKSWEAGLSMAFVSALSQIVISPDTLVTGVVSDSGSLIQVGGIEPKALAAKQVGADRLLVPPQQAVEIPGIAVEAVSTIEEVLERVTVVS